MTVTIYPKTMDRLAALAGMTRSEHDGEALNAVRLLGKALHGVGLTFDQVVRAGCSNLADLDGWGDNPMSTAPGCQASSTAPPAHASHAADVAWVLTHASMLSDKEADFIGKIAGYMSPISPKQRKWLDDIMARLRREVAA